jgi:hypothetical protein
MLWRLCKLESKKETYYDGEALAGVTASIGLTSAAVWVAFKATLPGDLGQFDIWVPLAIGFQGSAFSGIAKLPKKWLEVWFNSCQVIVQFTFQLQGLQVLPYSVMPSL